MAKIGSIAIAAALVAVLVSACGGGTSTPQQKAAQATGPQALSRPAALAAPDLQALFQSAARSKKALASTTGTALAVGATDPFGGGSPNEMVDRLFNAVAEVSFKQFFAPAPQPSLEFDVWRYRYYPDTDSYVGVPVKLSKNEDGGLFRDGIYVMGGTKKRADGSRVSSFTEQPLFVNMRVTDFVPPSADEPINCPSNQWPVNGVCAAMVADFALDFSVDNIVALDGTFENVRFVPGRNGGTAAVFPPIGLNHPVYLKIPNRPSLQFVDEATIDFWVMMDSSLLESWWNDPSQLATCAELISKTENMPGLQIWVCPNSDRNVPGKRAWYYGKFATNNFGGVEHSDGPWSALDVWNRITVTQSSRDGFRFYMNGRLAAANPTHRADFAVINRSDLYIGGGSPAYSLGRAATIQAVRIYKRAMSASEVERLN